MHFRFLSPLAAVPFVTLTGLGLFFFAFPGVSSRHSATAEQTRLLWTPQLAC